MQADWDLINKKKTLDIAFGQAVNLAQKELLKRHGADFDQIEGIWGHLLESRVKFYFEEILQLRKVVGVDMDIEVD